MISARAVMSMVAVEYRLSVEAMMGDERQLAELVRPRHVACYLCRELCGLSLYGIAKVYGMHHTTVLHGVRRIGGRRLNDLELDTRLRRLEARIRKRVGEEAMAAVVWTRWSEAKTCDAVKGDETAEEAAAFAAPPPPVPAPMCAEMASVKAAGRRFARAAWLLKFPFDAKDVPAAGTRCAWCGDNGDNGEAGHFCPARGFAGPVALCLACAAKETCGRAAMVERRMRGAYGAGEAEEDARMALNGSGPCRTVPLTAGQRRPVPAAGPEKAPMKGMDFERRYGNRFVDAGRPR